MAITYQKSDEKSKEGGNNFTQVDDFPRLVDQMRDGGLATMLIYDVVNFNELIRKLLQIVYSTVMFWESLDLSELV